MPRSSSAHVTWIVFGYPRSGNPEGVFFRNQAEALARAGVSVDVVVPTPHMPVPGLRDRWARRWQVPEGIGRPEVEGLVTVRRLPYVAYPGHIRWGWPGVLQERSIRLSSVAPSAIVHAHSAYPGGDAGLRLARSWGVPLVVTLHGGDVNVSPYTTRTARRRFLRVVRGADAVLAVSDSLADRTEAIAGVRPCVAPIGVKQDARPHGTRQAFRERYGLPRNGFVVLFVGHLMEQKGVHLLLEALAQLGSAGVHGAFVGSGELEPIIHQSPYATLIGPLPNSDVALAMAASDALALPSQLEGLSTVVCEAGVVGLPVIGSRIGGIRELLDRDRGFMISNLSSVEVSEAIDFVRRNPAEAHLRSARLQSYIRKHYDVEANARELRDTYVRLVADCA